MSANFTPRRGSTKGQQVMLSKPLSASGPRTSEKRNSKGNNVRVVSARTDSNKSQVSSRRSSTGDLRLDQGVGVLSKIHVRPRDDASILPTKPQGQIMIRQSSESNSLESTVSYVIDDKFKEFEKSLIREATTAIQNNPGPSAASLKFNRPRKKLKVDLDRMTIITNHIVVGSKRDASDSAAMKRFGITHILNVAQQLPNMFPQSFIYHKIDLLDAPETNIVDVYEEATSFLQRVEDMNGRVLVHCVAGVSRSVTVVLLHLVGTYEVYLKHAYNHMKSVRPYIHPNDGFMLQLAQFEVEKLGQSSVVKNAGSDWDFFEWNRIKYGYGKQQSIRDNVVMCLIL